MDATLGTMTVDLDAVLESRAVFYETLASLYFRPLKEEQIEKMSQADFSVYADINKMFGDGVNDIARYLRKRNSGTRQELAVDFTAAFAGTSTYRGKTAVPYKSVFASESGLMMQEGYHEVLQVFRRESVARREGLDWPDDHLSFLFQFMALMSRRCKEAAAQDDRENALRALSVSRDFLEQHIVTWFDEFMNLAFKLVNTRFYRGVLRITKGYIELDGETIEDLLDVVGE